MKMIATPGIATADQYANYVHNCLRNTSCEPSYAAPLPSVSSLQLYADFGIYEPAMFEFTLIDICTSGTQQITPAEYVAAIDPEDKWYGVFRAFNNPSPAVTTFVVFLSVTVSTPAGAQVKTYFSELLVVEPCAPLMKLKSCHPQGATLTGFDINGIYYGLPIGAFSGDNTVRYFHTAWVRFGKVREMSNKGTFKSSLVSTFRSTIEKIHQIETELVPKWYKNVLLAIYSRGAVSIDDGAPYIVSDLNFEAINDDDLQWKPYAQLKETFRLFYGCDDGLCEECCSPVVISATAEPGEPEPPDSESEPGGSESEPTGSDSDPGGSDSDPGGSESDPGESESDSGPSFPLGLRMKFTPDGYADFSANSLSFWNTLFNTTIRADAPFDLITLLPGSNEIVLTGPTEITILEASAFSGSLTLLEFHDDGEFVKEIGDSAFGNCENLTTVVFPANLINDNRAFDHCASLVNVTMPVLNLSSDSSFEACTSLTDISFPALTILGGSAFYQCSNLANVSIPNATNIQGFAFRECNGLQNLDISGASPIGSSSGNEFIFFNTVGATVTVTLLASEVGDGDITYLSASNTVTLNPV